MHTSGICTLCPVPGPRAEENGGADTVIGMVVSVLPGKCWELSGPGTQQLKTYRLCLWTGRGRGEGFTPAFFFLLYRQPQPVIYRVSFSAVKCCTFQVLVPDAPTDLELCVPNSVLTWVFPICLWWGVSGAPSETDSILPVCIPVFCCVVKYIFYFKGQLLIFELFLFDHFYL